MKLGQIVGDAREVQDGSPIALLLIDLLADPCSVLYSSLRLGDLLCVRLTCKEAWRSVHHKVLTKNNLWRTALNGMDETHVPLLRWCTRQHVSLDHATAERIGARGNMSLVEEFLGEYGCNELVSLLAVLHGRAPQQLPSRCTPDSTWTTLVFLTRER